MEFPSADATTASSWGAVLAVKVVLVVGACCECRCNATDGIAAVIGQAIGREKPSG